MLGLLFFENRVKLEREHFAPASEYISSSKLIDLVALGHVWRALAAGKGAVGSSTVHAADVHLDPLGPVLAVAAVNKVGGLEKKGSLGDHGRLELEQRGHERHVRYACRRQTFSQESVVLEAFEDDLGAYEAAFVLDLAAQD